MKALGTPHKMCILHILLLTHITFNPRCSIHGDVHYKSWHFFHKKIQNGRHDLIIGKKNISNYFFKIIILNRFERFSNKILANVRQMLLILHM